MRAFATSIALLLLGCGTQQAVKPSGEYKWENRELYSKLARGETTNSRVDHDFVIAKNTCKVDALKVPIPSPSCTQPPRQDCFGKTGFALGLCQTYTPSPQCDYSSVNAAYSAQGEIFDSCMMLQGWKKVWEPAVTASNK